MIEIKLKKKRILASSANTNEIHAAIIMFLLYYSICGKRKSVDFSYLSFCFDIVINQNDLSDNELSLLWDINELVKPVLLFLSSYELVEIDYKNGSLLTHITNDGKVYVEEMINEKLFKEINDSVSKLMKKITNKKIKNQKLIW